MAEKAWTPSGLLDVFGDDIARRILVLASGDPVSADDLATELDVSDPTIYRRLNSLAEYDLVRESQGIDPDGNHYRTFETTLRKATVEIEDGDYTIDLQVRQSIADQFETFLSDLEAPRPGSQGDDPHPSEDVHHG